MKETIENSTQQISDFYLGLAGITGFKKELIVKYNVLLDTLGTSEMLVQFERWVDEEQLECVISSIEDTLRHNNINIPYDTDQK